MRLPFGKSCLICAAKSVTFLSYTNAELERLVYQPSQVQDVHDGYDCKKQCENNLLQTFWALRRFGRPFTRTIGSMETLHQRKVTSIAAAVEYSTVNEA